MGSDREALINQALYTFARLNGFLVPGELKRPVEPAQAAGQQLQPIESSRPRPLPGPPTMVPGNDERKPFATPLSMPPVQKMSAAVQVDDALLGDDAQARTSMELPNLAASLGDLQQPLKIAPEPAGDRTLVLLAEGRELDRVVKDRFLIGRGKHCDLIINSGKVSREHAAITREGPAYFIEDLGSSNGTWFDKRRISRRQIAEGDEYFICSEKLSCAFR
jgi:hypothetical protein